MSDVPFGFTGSGAGDDDDERGAGGSGGGQGPVDPFAALFGGGGGFPGMPGMPGMDPAALGAAFQRLGELLSWQGGPVNWDLARQTARQSAAVGGDRFVGEAESREVADAVRLAELWLDEVTSLPAGTSGAVAWSRAQWVEETMPAWRALVDPVAGTVVSAMGAALTGSLPEEMRGQAAALTGPLQQMMGSMGGAMFGAQVGQAVGQLAGEVVSSTDVGLPLGPANRAVLVPANVAAFGEGLGLPADQVRLYLALREAAHQRLYAHVPWLRSRVVAAVDDYARGITVDVESLQRQFEERLGGIDPSDPSSLQGLEQALSEGFFTPANTPEQERALARLETLLALVEGWVDEVVDTAARDRLPSAGALRETVRRRRASGGPAEQTFAALVGLELRPRRLREAARLWSELGAARGTEGRDAVWQHPDLLPNAEDLDDPTGFVQAGGELDLSSLEDQVDRGGEQSGGQRPGGEQPGGEQPGGEQPGDDDRPDDGQRGGGDGTAGGA